MEALPIAAPRQQADRPREARARVAQLVEHATENRSVGGSTPSPGTTAYFSCSRVPRRPFLVSNPHAVRGEGRLLLCLQSQLRARLLGQPTW